MKKVFLGLAIILTMVLTASCCNRGKQVKAEGEVVEVVDSTACEAVDSLVVAE